MSAARPADQALGRLVRDKYRVTAPEVARLMAAHGLERGFVRQLAFNVAVGNTDAHAKNYSLLLAGGSPKLSPLYDTVPVVLYGQRFNTSLAMAVGGATRTADAGDRAWRRFAAQAGLDPGEVSAAASAVASQVADAYEGWMRAQGLDQARLRLVAKQIRAIRLAWAR